MTTKLNALVAAGVFSLLAVTLVVVGCGQSAQPPAGQKPDNQPSQDLLGMADLKGDWKGAMSAEKIINTATKEEVILPVTPSGKAPVQVSIKESKSDKTWDWELTLTSGEKLVLSLKEESPEKFILTPQANDPKSTGWVNFTKGQAKEFDGYFKTPFKALQAKTHLLCEHNVIKGSLTLTFDGEEGEWVYKVELNR